ncbi:mCG148083 [Mus musculus]|nr:mCG148083 [Mus musculus]
MKTRCGTEVEPCCIGVGNNFREPSKAFTFKADLEQ